MRRNLLVAAVTAAVAVTGSIAAGGVPAGAAVPGGRAAPGSELWTARLPTVTNTLSEAMAVSPGGAAVFVTGSVPRRGMDYEYATVAYGAATGKRLWARGYGHSYGHAANSGADLIAASPDGTTVFVTGFVQGGGEYLTVAYRS